MQTTKYWLLALILIAVFGPGCSGAGIISPDLSTTDEFNAIQTVADSGSAEINSGMLGLYQITLDSASGTGSIEPVRGAAAMDVLEAVDITGFMTQKPCSDCARIFGVGINLDGNIIMNLGVKHPFEAGNPAEPITGKNRIDLHVFNIEGTIITDNPKVINFPAESKDFATGYLVNADGYSNYHDMLIDNFYATESDAHPYILHFDDYSNGNFSASSENGFLDLMNPSGNLVMAQGADYSIKEYEFAVPNGEALEFMFAIGCTYGFTTDTYTERFNPVYRLPQHNKKAASEVHVEVIANNLEIGEPTTSATFRISIMDINHMANMGIELDEMLYASRVESIGIEIPGLVDAEFDSPTPISGDGRNSPLIYELTAFSEFNSCGSGEQPVLIKVCDSYPARQNPNPLLGNADGMGRGGGDALTPFLIIEFCTYQITTVDVASCTPVALRSNPIDIGVDGLGRPLIAYGDNQVWRYDYNYCGGEYVYTMNFPDAGDIVYLDAQADGTSIVVGDACNT
jgi:hypothetical protein